jgi:hypothetical protein
MTQEKVSKPLFRISSFVIALVVSTLPTISSADNIDACRIVETKWSLLSLGFPVKKERLKYIAKPRILVIPFHPSDAPGFSFGQKEKETFLQSARDIYQLSSGLSQIEFVFNSTIKLSINTSEMDKLKTNAHQVYLKDFEHDQFGFALKLIKDADPDIDYTGIDSVVLYGISKQSKEEIASALQFTPDMNFVGNEHKRPDGNPWFTPIITNEKIISNVVLMYNRSENWVITHELLHNYGLTDLYGAPNAPVGLSRMAGATDETLLTYEKWVMGWHPTQDVTCVSGNESNKVSKFLFDTKGREQIALVRPNQSNTLYVLETSIVKSKSVLSFYKLTNDARPPIEYYSYSNNQAGVNLADLSNIGKNYEADDYSVLIHSITDSVITVYLYPNSARTSPEVQTLISEAKVTAAKAAAELKTKQDAELKAKQEADAKAAAELKVRRDEAIAQNTLYVDSSSCGPAPTPAELQILRKGSWESLVPVLGWDMGKNCPSYHPYQAWTVAETEPNSQLRWVYWLNGVEWPGSPFRSILSTKAKQEAEAKAAAELKAKQEAEAKAAADLKAKQEAEAKVAAELKAKQEADAKAAAELKAKQEADAKAAADKAALLKAQSDLIAANAKAAADREALVKSQADLAAANASLAAAQKTNRDLGAQLTAIEGQFLVMSDSISAIQNQVLALNTKLTTTLKSLSTANAKIKKICSAKPKPKGC